jgi:hypothetical protein
LLGASLQAVAPEHALAVVVAEQVLVFAWADTGQAALAWIAAFSAQQGSLPLAVEVLASPAWTAIAKAIRVAERMSFFIMRLRYHLLPFHSIKSLQGIGLLVRKTTGSRSGVSAEIP